MGREYTEGELQGIKILSIKIFMTQPDAYTVFKIDMKPHLMICVAMRCLQPL